MPSAERTVTIRRPVADVFAFVADGTTAPQWRSGVLDVTLESGDGVGARYRQGVRGPGGRRIAADYEITRFEPNRFIGFRATAGPVRPVGSFTFADDTGATRLTFSLSADVSGWKRILMGRAIQSTMNAEMRALDRLKAILET